MENKNPDIVLLRHQPCYTPQYQAQGDPGLSTSLQPYSLIDT